MAGIKHATTGDGTKVSDTVWAEDHTIDAASIADAKLVETYLKTDGTRSMAGDLNFLTNKAIFDSVRAYGSSDSLLLRVGAGLANSARFYTQKAYFTQATVETIYGGSSNFHLATFGDNNNRALRFYSYSGGYVGHMEMMNGIMKLLTELNCNAQNLTSCGDLTIAADKTLVFTESTQLTIDAVGGITIQGNNNIVETNGGAAADNLDTINGGTDGQIIVLRAANDAHTVTLRDGVGNLSLAGGVNFDLDSDCDTIMLMFDGTAGLWLELSRSDNA